MKLLGNLDCESRWAGVALPGAVQQRISLYAALFAACAPDAGDSDRASEPHDVWVPAPVDSSRLLAHPGWTPPRVHTGVAPADLDLAWADPAARDANDRSRTLAIAQTLGVALRGACVVGSLAEIDDRIATLSRRPWICKARWTSAGRDRVRSAGALHGELRVRVERMLARFGPLVFEPWLDRIADFGVCAMIGSGGEVTVREPHRLLSDAAGGFVGIELVPIDPAITHEMQAIARAAAAVLANQIGYRGPFAIDAFVYRDYDEQTLHPLCELNARYSFGWIAHGLARRLGIRRLGFDASPAGATVLIAPGTDRVTAWCA